MNNHAIVVSEHSPFLPVTQTVLTWHSLEMGERSLVLPVRLDTCGIRISCLTGKALTGQGAPLYLTARNGTNVTVEATDNGGVNAQPTYI